MTPVGHSLTAITIGVVTVPETSPARVKTLYYAALVVLANVPDFPFTGWGHDAYRVSHSIFVNLALIVFCLSIGVFAWRLSHRVVRWRMVLGGVAAWLSHLLLDSMYNHGKGIAIFWPFSDARLALPVPWFSTLRNPRPFTDWQTLHVAVIEFVSSGALLVAVLLVQRIIRRHERRRAKPVL
ncbi:MAG: metal-dependent hydrolase [Anaerolineae bacterium]|nr:metal-dependent hydrolase [Anaerolineae bacterium]